MSVLLCPQGRGEQVLDLCTVTTCTGALYILSDGWARLAVGRNVWDSQRPGRRREGLRLGELATWNPKI